jgi:dihydrofolate reductase
MKLTTSTQVSVDGVMQANGGRDEKLDPGMERGGWARPQSDDEAMTFVQPGLPARRRVPVRPAHLRALRRYWGVREDLEDPIVGALNTKRKYVASNTLTDPQWARTTVLSGDLAASIRELKARPGGELQLHGSGTLIRWLLENELLDELSLLICPVVVGQGARLFPDAGISRSTSSTREPSRRASRARPIGPLGAHSTPPESRDSVSPQPGSPPALSGSREPLAGAPPAYGCLSRWSRVPRPATHAR